MDLFDTPITNEALRRFADEPAWLAAMRDVAGTAEHQELPDGYGLGGSRHLYSLGAPAARERIWLQCDGAFEPQVAAFLAWAMAESLQGTRASRYRHVAVGRAYLAVLGPSWCAPGEAVDRVPPVFDAGRLGATPAVLAALDRFAPTLVVHLQDWGRSTERAGAARNGQVGPSHLVPPGTGLRLVESFYLDPDLHRRIGERDPSRRRLRRRSPEARALDGHPDARLGQVVRQYVNRLGYRLFDAEHEWFASRDPSMAAAVRLAPGRYAVRAEWRGLGGASLAEWALLRFGATGLTGQTFDNPPEDRAAQALALADGAVMYRLGLQRLEPEP